MLDILIGVPWTMKSSFETIKAYRESLSELINRNAILVGSGGSFTASTFGEFIYLKGRGKVAKAVTPYELEGWEKVPEDSCVWLISHGGSNTDILGVALRLMKLNYENCIVFTGNKNSKLADLARQNQWKTIFVQSQERNFVSTIGLLSQVSALCGLLATEGQLKDLEDYFEYENLVKQFNSSLRETRSIAEKIVRRFGKIEDVHIIGFARGWGWPALIDLESKIVEGGICTIEMSELKNYTHGRWINLFGRRNRCVLLIRTPEDAELIEYLSYVFRKMPIFVIRTDRNGIVGTVDLFIKTLLLTHYLGQKAKRNILKPKFPVEGRGLYSWEPQCRRGYWKNKPELEKEEHRTTSII